MVLQISINFLKDSIASEYFFSGANVIPTLQNASASEFSMEWRSQQHRKHNLVAPCTKTLSRVMERKR